MEIRQSEQIRKSHIYYDTRQEQQVTWEEAVIWLRQQPDKTELVKDCFFDDPLTDAAERYYRSTEWQAVRELLPAHPGKALDLGAGRGISSYALAKDGWQVVALEPDKSPIVGAGALRALATESGLPISVVEDWGESLPFPDESFDLVHCRQVLHHARNLSQLCREIRRVMKKKGAFIATREHVISRKEDLPVFLNNHPLHNLYGGENAFKLKEYISAISGAGFRLTHILNPFESDINLFPNTISGLKVDLSGKMKWPWPRLIPDMVLKFLGSLIRTPGRVYTFVGRKV
ncbi:MAG: class I SAM-dependent methyltransferase [Nitrospirota bacterium]|nr:class I SAM-dependent methyltransferase [Nitrospirota bacterium]